MAALPLAIIGLGLSGAGTALSASGQLAGAAAARYAGEVTAQDILDTGLANAEEAEYSAANIREAADLSEKQWRYQAGQVMAKNRAAQGASGLLANQGSPLDVSTENSRQSEIQALEIRRNADIQINAIQRQSQADIEHATRLAQVARAGGQATATRLSYGGASIILGGGYQVAEDAKDLLGH